MTEMNHEISRAQEASKVDAGKEESGISRFLHDMDKDASSAAHKASDFVSEHKGETMAATAAAALLALKFAPGGRLIALGLGAAGLAGCAELPRTNAGAAIGAVVGAATTGDVKGAARGAIIGGVGGLILDDADARARQQGSRPGYPPQQPGYGGRGYGSAGCEPVTAPVYDNYGRVVSTRIVTQPIFDQYGRKIGDSPICKR